MYLTSIFNFQYLQIQLHDDDNDVVLHVLGDITLKITATPHMDQCAKRRIEVWIQINSQ